MCEVTGEANDFVYEEDFLDATTCKRLVDHFNQAIGVKNVTNVNPLFDNRVVYYESIADPQIKSLMRRIHEDVVRKVSDFYGLDYPIYPEATHLVKWPVGSSLGNHADNAYEDGTPNYVPWRTHSAVIYLNDDFEGGHFYFKKLLPKTVKPRSGLLVGFTGGLNHVHGVNMITNGTRYAMPMWFCSEKSRAYPEYK